ncbi:MAG: acyltransferase family protein [Chlorobium sp.]
MDLKYRPDIDGLRAIAVLAVLFFHTEVPGFSSGFVGVDIFFVISGYLITSIILKDLRANRFSIARFYERRIRRIFPALFPVMVFVLAVGAYLFDQSAFKNLGKSITATTLFSSNIIFWRESGYFDAPSLEKPLLHTWSLSVEEQFYIVFPIVLMLIGRYLKGRYLPLVLAAFVLSFGASVYGVAHYPGATFYLVPTRAWELLAGSLLALGVFPAPSSVWQKNLFAFTGLIMIGCSIFLYTEATPFPGLAALLPVMGSGLIIQSGRGGGMYSAQKLLATRPLVFVGLISYSLYLWHWPLVTFTKYLLFRSMNGYDSAGIIITSFILASLSWKFIEQPFRGKEALIPGRNRLFVLAGFVMAMFIGSGFLIYLQKGMGGRISPEIVRVVDKAKNDPVWNLHWKWEEQTASIGKGIDPPIVGDKKSIPIFALIGDSHASALIPAMEQNAVINNISGYMITQSSVPFLLGIAKKYMKNDNNIDEVKYNNAVIDFVKKNKNIQTVILVSRWAANISGAWRQKGEESISITLTDKQSNNNQTNTSTFRIGLKRTVDALLKLNKKVVLVTDYPEIGYDVPRSYYFSARWPEIFNVDSIRPTVAEYNERQKAANAIIEEIANLPGVTRIRTERRFFDEYGKGIIMASGELLYRDDDHLSTAGALYVAPVFDEVFKKMATDQRKRPTVLALQ